MFLRGQHWCLPITTIRGRLWMAHITSCSNKSEPSIAEQIWAVHGRSGQSWLPNIYVVPSGTTHPRSDGSNYIHYREYPTILSFRMLKFKILLKTNSLLIHIILVNSPINALLIGISQILYNKFCLKSNQMRICG